MLVMRVHRSASEFGQGRKDTVLPGSYQKLEQIKLDAM